jgi:hypothetical protein
LSHRHISIAKDAHKRRNSSYTRKQAAGPPASAILAHALLLTTPASIDWAGIAARLQPSLLLV